MGILDQPKKILNPVLWDLDNRLIPEVKLEILQKLVSIMPDRMIKDVWFIGSNASLQYNDFSDVDISIVTNIPYGKEYDEEFREWHLAFKTHNHKMDYLTGTTHPINFFAMRDPQQLINWGDETTSVYDVLQDTWAKLPLEFENIRDPKQKFLLETPIANMYVKLVRNHLNRITNDLQEISISEGKDLQNKLRELDKSIDEAIDLYEEFDDARKFQYSTGWGVPKLSDKNFYYKVLERRGLLKILSDLKESFN